MSNSDSLESAVAKALTSAGIQFTRPDRDAGVTSTLDFFVPSWHTYIECKAHSCERLHNQCENRLPHTGVIVLIGKNAVEAFTQYLRSV